ncbi:NAD(P)-binding protein [Stipitochalara longipes BDJ]|nr:NAD(P)-binding protein [Stipitochalara longipes BDJ]
MTAPNKIIVVVGATGNQGSSVTHEFLKLPNWHVRCLTRNPSSAASEALVVLGAEVVQADLSDISSLTRAFANANAIFLNTNFWETYKALVAKDEKSASAAAFEAEVSHGINAAIAAAGIPSLERLIYSALPPMRAHSKGKYGSGGHWDTKATVIEYILKEQPELAKKLSLIYLGGYNTNPMLAPRFNPANGKYSFISPLAKEIRMPVIDPKESTGLFVRALVEDEDAGTKLLAYDTDSYLTIGEIVDLWSKASGQEADYLFVPPAIMHQQFGISMELLDAPGFITEYGYMGGVDNFIEPSQLKTQVKTQSLENWMMGRDWKEVLDSLNPAGK